MKRRIVSILMAVVVLCTGVVPVTMNVALAEDVVLPDLPVLVYGSAYVNDFNDGGTGINYPDGSVFVQFHPTNAMPGGFFAEIRSRMTGRDESTQQLGFGVDYPGAISTGMTDLDISAYREAGGYLSMLLNVPSADLWNFGEFHIGFSSQANARIWHLKDYADNSAGSLGKWQRVMIPLSAFALEGTYNPEALALFNLNVVGTPKDCGSLLIADVKVVQYPSGNAKNTGYYTVYPNFALTPTTIARIDSNVNANNGQGMWGQSTKGRADGEKAQQLLDFGDTSNEAKKVNLSNADYWEVEVDVQHYAEYRAAANARMSSGGDHNNNWWRHGLPTAILGSTEANTYKSGQERTTYALDDQITHDGVNVARLQLPNKLENTSANLRKFGFASRMVGITSTPTNLSRLTWTYFLINSDYGDPDVNWGEYDATLNDNAGGYPNGDYTIIKASYGKYVPTIAAPSFGTGEIGVKSRAQTAITIDFPLETADTGNVSYTAFCAASPAALNQAIAAGASSAACIGTFTSTDAASGRIEATASGLTGGTTYYFAISAKNGSPVEAVEKIAATATELPETLPDTSDAYVRGMVDETFVVTLPAGTKQVTGVEGYLLGSIGVLSSPFRITPGYKVTLSVADNNYTARKLVNLANDEIAYKLTTDQAGTTAFAAFDITSTALTKDVYARFDTWGTPPPGNYSDTITFQAVRSAIS